MQENRQHGSLQCTALALFFSNCVHFSILLCHIHDLLPCFLQTNPLKNGTAIFYRCKENHRKHCKCMMKITTTLDQVTLSVTNQHNPDIDYSIGLTNTQKDLLKGAVQQDPLASCNTLRRGLERSSPEHRISHSKLKLARTLATSARKEVMLPILNGIPLKGTYRDLADLAISKDLGAAIRKHNAGIASLFLGLRQ